MVDTKRLISEVAVRNGFRIDERDPAFCVVTLSELVLEEAAKRIADDIRLAAGEFERAAEKVQVRAGTLLAQQINDVLVAAKLRFEAEILAATTQNSKKVMSLHQFQVKFAAQWITVGLAASAIVLTIGILVGMALP